MTVNELVSELASERKKKKITQGDMAKRLNVTRATISKIESFKLSPRLDLVVNYACEVGMNFQLQADHVNQLMDNLS